MQPDISDIYEILPHNGDTPDSKTNKGGNNKWEIKTVEGKHCESE
jgi:hypothetical protein